MQALRRSVKIAQSLDKQLLQPRSYNYSFVAAAESSAYTDCVSLAAQRSLNTMGNTETYYHYTTTSSAKVIYRSGVIRKSMLNVTSRRGDGFYETGVYLTNISPRKFYGRRAFYNAVIPSELQGKIDLRKSCSNNFPGLTWLCRVIVRTKFITACTVVLQ